MSGVMRGTRVERRSTEITKIPFHTLSASFSEVIQSTNFYSDVTMAKKKNIRVSNQIINHNQICHFHSSLECPFC